MSSSATERVDEVSQHYEAARKLDTACGILFYVLMVVSFTVLFPERLGTTGTDVLKGSFLMLSVFLFGAFLVSKLWLVPSAERVRRKQLLADAFGTPLTPETTHKYYNNKFSPSHQRLAANVLENAFFGKEVSGKMLPKVRWVTGAYLFSWLGVLVFRYGSMDTILWITQIVFSADIAAYWLSLETLRSRHNRVYEDLYEHFLHGHGEEEAKAKASILDSFATYESAKAVAGILLSTKVFERENPKLSKDWDGLRKRLGLDEQNANCSPDA